MILDAKIIWFIAGLIMVLLEFVAPGVIIVFFGFGAWVVAIGMWLGLIESVVVQCAVFSLSSLLLLFLLRRYVASWFVGGTLGTGGNVDEEFIGKRVRVIHAIGGGADTGKVELKGAQWTAFCDTPLASGSNAMVIKRDGIHLIVKAI